MASSAMHNESTDVALDPESFSKAVALQGWGSHCQQAGCSQQLLPILLCESDQDRRHKQGRLMLLMHQILMFVCVVSVSSAHHFLHGKDKT